MTAIFYVGDAIEVMSKLPEKSVDLVISSPPFLALRSYLPSDHPDKPLEGGSQATPGEYVDWLLDVVEACARVLAPHGSLCFELGDTYAGSGGAGGDYDPGGWREGQEAFAGSALRHIDAKYERVQDDAKHTSSIRNLHGKKQPGGPAWPLAKSLSLIPESFRWAMVYGRVGSYPADDVAEPPRFGSSAGVGVVSVGALGDKWRPATSELMVFCKSKNRYFDLDATREAPSSNTHVRSSVDRFDLPSQKRDGNWSTLAQNDYANPAGAPPLDWWQISGEPDKRWWCGKHQGTATFHPVTTPLVCSAAPPIDGNGPVCSFVSHLPDWWEISLLDDEAKPQSDKGKPRNRQAEASMTRGGTGAKTDGWHRFPNFESSNPLGAPPLDWWNIPPGGYPGAHYAVWPPELLIKPIKAMCPEKVCRECGEPRRRMVGEVAYVNNAGRPARMDMNQPRYAPGVRQFEGYGDNAAHRIAETLGFSDCGHDDWRPGLVLDPFAGSGTTLSVATGHGRDAIGIDLDSRNVALARDRVGSLFFETEGQ